MLNPALHLIGTVHVDPMGTERLDRVLADFSPDVIALEMAKSRDRTDSDAVRNRRVEDLVSSLDLYSEEERAIIKRFCTYVSDDVWGYELKSSKEYVQKNPKTKLEYIDLDTVNPDDLFLLLVSAFKQFLPKKAENVESLISDLKLMVAVSYFQNDIGRPQTELKDIDIKGMSEKDVQTLAAIYSPKRDDFMAENIRRLYTENRVIAIVGVEHLNGLKRRLEDLCPTVLALNEAAKKYI